MSKSIKRGLYNERHRRKFHVISVRKKNRQMVKKEEEETYPPKSRCR